MAEVWIALPHGEEAGAVFGVAAARSLATTAAGKPVGAVLRTAAKLLAEVPREDAGAGGVAGLAVVQARLVVGLVGLLSL